MTIYNDIDIEATLPEVRDGSALFVQAYSWISELQCGKCCLCSLYILCGHHPLYNYKIKITLDEIVVGTEG